MALEQASPIRLFRRDVAAFFAPTRSEAASRIFDGDNYDRNIKYFSFSLASSERH